MYVCPMMLGWNLVLGTLHGLFIINIDSSGGQIKLLILMIRFLLEFYRIGSNKMYWF